jgi:hypothetical protein
VFRNKGWDVTPGGLSALDHTPLGYFYIPAWSLLEIGEGCYAWPMRLAFLGGEEFELFVDAFRAAVSHHAASTVDAELLQLSIDRARQRVANEGEAAKRQAK